MFSKTVHDCDDQQSMQDWRPATVFSTNLPSSHHWYGCVRVWVCNWIVAACGTYTVSYQKPCIVGVRVCDRRAFLVLRNHLQLLHTYIRMPYVACSAKCSATRYSCVYAQNKSWCEKWNRNVKAAQPRTYRVWAKNATSIRWVEISCLSWLSFEWKFSRLELQALSFILVFFSWENSLVESFLSTQRLNFFEKPQQKIHRQNIFVYLSWIFPTKNA